MIATTKVFIFAFIFIAIVYDVFAMKKSGSDATISVVTYTWSRGKYGPILVFALGALCYHLFINQ